MARSGSSLNQIVHHLTQRGFDRENFRTFALVTTRTARGAGQPDVYGRITDATGNFAFPWGNFDMAA